MVHTDISDAVRTHALRNPSKVALVFEGRRTTYEELNKQVNQAANGLIRSGIGSQDRVAILDQNSDQFFTLWLAAARIGAVIVPLNARLAAPEVAVILKDSGAKLLFAGQQFQSIVNDVAAEVPSVTGVVTMGAEFNYWREQNSAIDLHIPVGRNDVCVQLYTSGTTGVPKGVQLTHENGLRPFSVAGGALESPWKCLTPQDVVLVCLPHGHIAGCGVGLVCLHFGSTLVIVRDFVPPALVSLINEERVTFTMMVPIMIRGLMAGMQSTAQRCDSLKAIIYGAAPMATSLLKEAMNALPDVDFAQVYGLTETCGPITYLNSEMHHRIAAGDDSLAQSCGRPLPEVEVRIVGEDGAQLPPGQIGEIVCRAPQVMKGYWHRDAENKAVLQDGWFHSGDIGMVDEAGYFYIHDRKRDMIITGGENVYPAVVENILHSHPSVFEAAVIGVPDEKWGEAVKAIVALRPNAEATAEDILSHLRGQLAGFNIPKSVDFVESLPRNPTGKVLRRMLREPYWVGQERNVA